MSSLTELKWHGQVSWSRFGDIILPKESRILSDYLYKVARVMEINN